MAKAVRMELRGFEDCMKDISDETNTIKANNNYTMATRWIGIPRCKGDNLVQYVQWASYNH